MTIREQSPSLIEQRSVSRIATLGLRRLPWPAAILFIFGVTVLLWLGIIALIRSLG